MNYSCMDVKIIGPDRGNRNDPSRYSEVVAGGPSIQVSARSHRRRGGSRRRLGATTAGERPAPASHGVVDGGGRRLRGAGGPTGGNITNPIKILPYNIYYLFRGVRRSTRGPGFVVQRLPGTGHPGPTARRLGRRSRGRQRCFGAPATGPGSDPGATSRIPVPEPGRRSDRDPGDGAPTVRGGQSSWPGRPAWQNILSTCII